MRDLLPTFPGYALRRAANATAAGLASRLTVLGLRQVDVSVLMLIADNEDLTASAIGRQLDIQRANMVPLLNRHEKAGWIKRVPLDKKSQAIRLTEAGTKMHEDGVAVVKNFEEELIARVPAEHRKHLLPALNALWK